MKKIMDKSNRVIAEKVRIADSMGSRLMGLMFIKEMKGFDGLMLEPCNSVHNCFMRFSTDVIFLNRENKIVKILRNFKPWRFSWVYFKSKKVLELKAGTLPADIKEGDVLEVIDV